MSRLKLPIPAPPCRQVSQRLFETHSYLMKLLPQQIAIAIAIVMHFTAFYSRKLWNCVYRSQVANELFYSGSLFKTLAAVFCTSSGFSKFNLLIHKVHCRHHVLVKQMDEWSFLDTVCRGTEWLTENLREQSKLCKTSLQDSGYLSVKGQP